MGGDVLEWAHAAAVPAPKQLSAFAMAAGSH